MQVVPDRGGHSTDPFHHVLAQHGQAALLDVGDRVLVRAGRPRLGVAGGDVEHLHTWELKTAFVDRSNLLAKLPANTTRFAPVSTERAELEHFARAAEARRPLALPGGDEVHNVAVLEAILASAQTGTRISL